MLQIVMLDEKKQAESAADLLAFTNIETRKNRDNPVTVWVSKKRKRDCKVKNKIKIKIKRDARPCDL